MSIHIQEFMKRAEKYPVKNGLPLDIVGRLEVAKLLPNAQCFDFGEYRDFFHGGHFTLHLKSTPFPAPICWYEFTDTDKDRMALLVDSRAKDYLRVQPFLAEKQAFFGLWVEFEYATQKAYSYCRDESLETRLREQFSKLPIDGEACKEPIDMCLYMTIMINTKDIILSDKIPIPRQRMIGRQARDNIPRFDYRTVKVDPERIVNVAAPPSHSYNDDEPGYSQRYHFRIGHWRHLSDGSKIAVRGYWAGSKELGAIEKEYDCRELVKRDLFSAADGKRPWRKPRIVQDLFA